MQGNGKGKGVTGIGRFPTSLLTRQGRNPEEALGGESTGSQALGGESTGHVSQVVGHNVREEDIGGKTIQTIKADDSNDDNDDNNDNRMPSAKGSLLPIARLQCLKILRQYALRTG